MDIQEPIVQEEEESKESPVEREVAKSDVQFSYSQGTKQGCCGGCAQFINRFVSESTQVELKQLFDFAWPVLLSNTSALLITTITIFFCGRLGKTPLAAATLATSFTNVTGFSVGFGLTGAMDTLCTQAFGANKKKRVGVILQRRLIIIGMCCLPIWGLWLNTKAIVEQIVHDRKVVILTGMFMDYYIPALAGILGGLILQKYLQTQGLVKPPIYVGAVTCVFHVVFNSVLVFALHLGLRGAAIAATLSNLCFGILTLAYIKWKELHVDTWGGWTRDCLREWGQYIRLAVPGMLMICIEWWGFEVGTFLMGNLGVDILGAHGILFQVYCLVYMIPMGIGVATGISVGMVLGKGDYEQAKSISLTAVKLTACIGLVFLVLINSCKDVIGRIFTANRDVIKIASEAVPAMSAVVFLDSLQSVMSGSIRGCGIQGTAAAVTLICYDVVAVPLALVLAFLTKLRLVGFWLGIACGIFFQVLFYAICLWRLDWQEKSHLARARAGTFTSSIKGVQDTSVEKSEKIPSLQDDTMRPRTKSVTWDSRLSTVGEVSGAGVQETSVEKSEKIALLQDDTKRPRTRSVTWDSSLTTSGPPSLGAFVGRKMSGLMLPAEIFLRQVRQREVVEHSSFEVYTISHDAAHFFPPEASSRDYGSATPQAESADSERVVISQYEWYTRSIALFIALTLFAAGILGRCLADVT